MLLLGEKIKSTKLSIRTSHQFASPTSPLKKKRHGPREVNTHVFHIRQIKRGYNELQLLVLFKLSDASFFFLLFFLDDCIGHFFQFCYNVHLSGATLHLQQCCRHEWKTNSIEFFQATFMSVLNCLFFRLKHYRILSFPLGVSLPRNAVGQLWIHPSP